MARELLEAYTSREGHLHSTAPGPRRSAGWAPPFPRAQHFFFFFGGAGGCIPLRVSVCRRWSSSSRLPRHCELVELEHLARAPVAQLEAVVHVVHPGC